MYKLLKFALLSSGLFLSACLNTGGGTAAVTPTPIMEFGCKDPMATNYNPIAKEDDGSCIYGDIGNNDHGGLNDGTYTAFWNPPSDPGLIACDGTQVVRHTMTHCILDELYSVDHSYCSGIQEPDPVTYTSPAGSRNLTVANGSKTITCDAGSPSPSNVVYHCNSGYVPNGGACSLTPDTTPPSIMMSGSSCNYPDETVAQFPFPTCCRMLFSYYSSNLI